MEMQTDKLGWVAGAVFLICLCYFILKRIKIHDSKAKINLRQALNFHCYLAIIGTIIAIFHVGQNIFFIQISAGFICFSSMILLCISGIVIRCLRGISPASRRIWRFIHVGLAIVFVGALLWHATLYHFIMN